MGRGSEGGSRAREGSVCLGRILLQSLDYTVHPGLIWGCSELMTLSVVESEVRRNQPWNLASCEALACGAETEDHIWEPVSGAYLWEGAPKEKGSKMVSIGPWGGDWERRRSVTLQSPLTGQQCPAAILEEEIGTKRHQKDAQELGVGSPQSCWHHSELGL